MAEISSYNFLHRIRNLLCTTDYLELSRDLVQNGLDARVASGPDALRVTLNRLKTTIAVLEPVVEKVKGKVKTKSAHVVDSGNKEDGEPGHLDWVYSIDSRLTTSGRWWNRSFQFPCPLAGHDHELSSFKDFFQMSPKERQDKSKGKICKTCFKVGGDCLGPNGKCSTDVPVDILCKGCVAYCARGRLSPHNLLFCSSKHSTHAKPSKENLPKIFEKYFGRPWGQTDSTEQIRYVHVHSNEDKEEDDLE